MISLLIIQKIEAVEDDNERINILKEMGLSGEQFSQIVEDITSLTKWTDEEAAHFFG